MTSDPGKFFVCGPPKSGTTWLQLMLNAHPAVICAGEGHLTDWVLAPLRRLLTTYNEQLQFNNELLYRERATQAGFSERDFNEIARFIVGQRLAKLRARKPDAVVVGDKTPNYAYALGLLSAIFPDCRFVYLVRDPRDSVVSMLHQTRRLEQGAAGRRYERDEDIFEGYLRKWVEVNRLYLKHRAAHPGSTLDLRYEDLVADEAPGLRSVFGFLGVAVDDPAVVAACREAGRFEALSGGRARGQRDDRSFFRRGEAGAWKSELGERAAALVTPEVAEVMAEFGYRA